AQYLMQETVDTKPVKDKTGAETARSGQLLVLTRAETEFLAEQAVRILEQARAAGVDPTDLKALAKVAPIDKKALAPILKELPASVDTALFGRMVTSDLFARVDAAVSVAHAFTTHAETAETDYFTAVDTLNVDDAGAGLVQDTELTSGVFYTYAVIDMEQLRANLGREAELAEREAELICLAGFMRLLSAGFVARREGRILNIHPSLLPLFPGLHTHARAIEAGMRVHGCTVHFVDEHLDHGVIILQKAVEVADADTAETLSARIQREEHRLYPEAIQLLAEGRLELDGRRVRIRPNPENGGGDNSFRREDG
ncbi:MAG: phosphoribosylglycinamide formyltransferase, partial [Limnochordales bacterium]